MTRKTQNSAAPHSQERYPYDDEMWRCHRTKRTNRRRHRSLDDKHHSHKLLMACRLQNKIHPFGAEAVF
jgi:hypothetical protein